MLRRMLYSQLLGTVLYGVDGIRVGQVRRVLVDEITGRPEWVAVSTGALGARQRLVPIAAADLQLGGIRVPYPAVVILAAPRFDLRDAAPTQDAEEELYRHYGMDSEPPPARPSVTDRNHGRDGDGDGDGDHGDDAPVPTVRTGDGGIVRSVGGWDLGKIRQLLDHAFSYPQQLPEPAGEVPTVDATAPSIESEDEKDPRI